MDTSEINRLIEAGGEATLPFDVLQEMGFNADDLNGAENLRQWAIANGFDLTADQDGRTVTLKKAAAPAVPPAKPA
jgi:hypothetical protein